MKRAQLDLYNNTTEPHLFAMNEERRIESRLAAMRNISMEAHACIAITGIRAAMFRVRARRQGPGQLGV